MSRALSELSALNQGYTRLAEKFKVVWTFHQFLQGVYKTFLGGPPVYRIDFQARYDQVKGVTAAMTFRSADEVSRLIHNLDGELDGLHRTLLEADQKVAPSELRRFLERVRTEDDKLVMSVLKFYFYLRYAPQEVLDKMDLLLTLAGARKSLDEERFMLRLPVELERFLTGLLSLTPRPAPDQKAVRAAVEQLVSYRVRIEGCAEFEDLVSTQVLELLRAFKHNIGSALYDAEVLTALLETNVATKNKYLALYQSEERRIEESSRQLLTMERELSLRDPASLDDELVFEFQRFHHYRREFEGREKGVRRRDVAKLAESIDVLMSRLELASPAVSGEAPLAEPAPRPRVVAGGRAPVSGLESDPLTADWAARVLSAVDMADEGTGSGRAASGGLVNLRLEPWEVRAARHVLRDELAPDPADRARELLYFEAAVVRSRIDDEAEAMRGPVPRDPEHMAAQAARLGDCALVLGRAQDLDRRFRQEVDAAARLDSPERTNEVNRSRFRLLRAFSGLWLLHNRHAGGVS